MKLIFIDHYDSFSFNLIDWLTSAEIDVVRYEADDDEVRSLMPDAPLVLSPGPKSPEYWHNTLDLIERFKGKVPILGICLGHQVLAYSQGIPIVRSIDQRHGVRKVLTPDKALSMFNGMPPFFSAGSYHSLVVSESDLTDDAYVSCRCDSGEVQGIEWRYKNWPAWGVQFHPESFLSDQMDIFRSNWLSLTESYYASLSQV